MGILNGFESTFLTKSNLMKAEFCFHANLVFGDGGKKQENVKKLLTENDICNIIETATKNGSIFKKEGDF